MLRIGPINIKWKKKHKLHLLPGFRDVREQSTAPMKNPVLYPSSPGKRRNLLATFQMTDSQQVTMTVAFTDKKGNPAPPPTGSSAPGWFVDNSALLSLTPAPDGLSCVVAAQGPLGTGTVSVKVNDASGNPLASGSVDVTIVGGAPTQVVITPGTPSEQP